MTRVRVGLLVLVLVVSLAVAAGYFLNVRQEAGAAAPVALATLPVAAVLAGPRIVFRNAALGADYSRLALVPLADPGGPRALTDISCQRLYATARAGVCVTATRGIAPSYGVALLGPDLAVRTKSALVGQPSRARMSADGRLVSTTTFVTGHSYAAASFSTETLVRRDGRSLGSLEGWRTTLPDGRLLTASDRNYWGVTFASDDDTFFATAAAGGTTWLVRGSLAARTMTALRTDAECPSLSPDGRKVAYKKRLGVARPGVWRLAVDDLAGGTETLLGETRSVDDQVEWLDDSTLLYALPRGDGEATTTDVWSVPADGSGTPVVLIPQASSPAVVR
jgi:hypothetical protein